MDPDQPVTNTRTLDEILARSGKERRFNMALLTSFATLALALAMFGVYAIVAQGAVQRTREIGIRIALGARSNDVIGLIVKNGLQWSAFGVAAGVVGAFGLTRLMRSLLFGIEPTDPLTFIGVIVAVMGVVMLASVVPARRATKLDPVSALRTE
jgi:putative ABC transport system permease protein